MGAKRALIGVAAGVAVAIVAGYALLRGPEYGRMIRAAEAFERNGNYSETRVFTGSGDEHRQFRRRDAGGARYDRSEYRDDVMVSGPAAGGFRIFPALELAVKDPEWKPQVEIPDSLIPDLDAYTEYRVEEKECYGVPCYYIAQHFIVSDGLYRVFLEFSEKVRAIPGMKVPPAEELEKIYREQLASGEYFVYGIGKENGFLYSRIRYDASGRPLYGYESKDVVIDPEMPDSLFEVPAGFMIERPAQRQEFWQVVNARREEAREAAGATP